MLICGKVPFLGIPIFSLQMNFQGYFPPFEVPGWVTGQINGISMSMLTQILADMDPNMPIRVRKVARTYIPEKTLDHLSPPKPFKSLLNFV